jgi:hypothetical protein
MPLNHPFFDAALVGLGAYELWHHHDHYGNFGFGAPYGYGQQFGYSPYFYWHW